MATALAGVDLGLAVVEGAFPADFDGDVVLTALVVREDDFTTGVALAWEDEDDGFTAVVALAWEDEDCFTVSVGLAGVNEGC